MRDIRGFHTSKNPKGFNSWEETPHSSFAAKLDISDPLTQKVRDSS